jgi:hypothetical protein
MRRPLSEHLLRGLALLSTLIAFWQLALFASDNSFVDGICAALVRPQLAPEERAMTLFRWVSHYDTAEATPPGGTASSSTSSAGTRPFGLLSPRAMIEHRDYFRENCGSKAWLLAVMARRSGLEARELRLCDASHVARHVVCEVRIDGRWCVFDPTVGLDFRRTDGQLATAAELRDPALLAANARRAPSYDLRRWQFAHPERLHYEKVPLVGGHLRRLAARVTGRPAEELAIPFSLEQPRLVAAGTSVLLALLSLSAAGLLLRRRSRACLRVAQREQAPLRAFALESSEQD